MALCAVAQGSLTFYLIGSKPIQPVLGLLFIATTAIYNFSILLSKPKNPENSAQKRVRWFFSHYRLMVTLTVVPILLLAPLFFLVSVPARILLIFLAVLSFAYGLPLFAVGDSKFGLRNIPGLKIFLITLVWTMSCVLLPILEAQARQMVTLSLYDTTIFMAKEFLFIGALAIPFDIRDIFEDKQSGLKTIAVAWGEKNAYFFCEALLLGYIALLLFFRVDGFGADFWALIVSVVIAGWLILRSKWEKNEYYYFFFLDGILILQYIFVIGLNKLNILF